MTDQALPPADLANDIRVDASRLEQELAEIELLVQQARTEAARYEARRVSATERLAEMRGRAPGSERGEAADQLLTVAARAQMMQAQIEILEGKQRALTRYRDRLIQVLGRLDGVPTSTGAGAPAGTETPIAGESESRPEFSRGLLSAQEDLRRAIARSMHDGPAQSLTNIALQAEIVQRLVVRDPAAAETEVERLVEMVQRALEATKSFIFDVRPMVLDDLGLVPTLRRAAHDRGRRAQILIDFDSAGADRRLDPEVESGLFRILDDALVGYLSTNPQAIEVRLDWSEEMIQARVESLWETRGQGSESSATAVAPGAAVPASPDGSALGRIGRRRNRSPETAEPEVPHALAAMIAERREETEAASVAAASASVVARALPAQIWREIQARARSLGVAAQVVDDGRALLVAAGMVPLEG